MHGRMGYGRPEPDVEGERTLEYALAFNLLLGNTCFKKHDSHLITYMYKSGDVATQIEFILFRKTMHKFVTDVKVIPGEEVALQHQLACDIRIDVPPKSKCKFTSHLNIWKLKDPQTSSHFQEVFFTGNLHVSASAGVADADIDCGLRISGTTSRLACSRQLRRYVTQLGPTVGVVKPGGTMSMWKSHCCQTESFQGLEDW